MYFITVKSLQSKGITLTLVHNEIFDGPIECYKNNPEKFIVDEREI